MSLTHPQNKKRLHLEMWTYIRGLLASPPPPPPALQAGAAFDKLFLSIVAILVVAVVFDRRRSTSAPPSPAQRTLQRRYLTVWLCFKAADWMQGPYFHDLYSSKVIDGVSITDAAVANLFLCGFVSAMLFGGIAGGLVDRHGRRRACVAFALLQTVAALSTMAQSYPLLALGRVCGGFATSILMAAPEAWLCSEHNRQRLPASSLGALFGAAYFADALVAIGAGQIADAAAAAAGPAAPFLTSIAFLGAGAAAALAGWKENYGVSSSGGSGGGMMEALRILARDPAVRHLSLLQALFEGAMYIFVLVWGGAMASAVQEARAGATPFGRIFSCFMACCMLGGALFSFMGSLNVRPERYMQPVLVIARQPPTPPPRKSHARFVPPIVAAHAFPAHCCNPICFPAHCCSPYVFPYTAHPILPMERDVCVSLPLPHRILLLNCL